MQYLTKEQIVNAAQKKFAELTMISTKIDEDIFFKRPAEEKWSAAEHIKHLILAMRLTTLAFYLPSFVARLIAGKPNRKSRSYEELVEKYKLRLSQGGRASAAFVPQKIKKNKEQLIVEWEKEVNRFINTFQKRTTETKLDSVLARHPLLGRITLRELGYFTIYHTEHHLNIINNIINPKPA